MLKDRGNVISFARIHGLIECTTQDGRHWPMAVITRFKTKTLPQQENIGMRRMEEANEHEAEVICTDDILRLAFLASTDDASHHPHLQRATARTRKPLPTHKTYFLVDFIDSDLFLRLHVHKGHIVIQ